jgi:uncharacterized protein (TIGR02594 family)
MPKWLDLAVLELGTKEAPGYTNNPIVTGYFKDAGAGKLPDSVPWCAAFVGAMLKRAGVSPSGYLAARSYLKWGVKCKPVQGCIVVLKRGTSPWQGHVTFLDRVNPNGTLRCLGGNQTDAVTYANYSPAFVLGYRWPLLKGRGK